VIQIQRSDETGEQIKLLDDVEIVPAWLVEHYTAHNICEILGWFWANGDEPLVFTEGWTGLQETWERVAL
jgi:hypothetical protein